MRSSSWARARSNKAVLTSSLAQTWLGPPSAVSLALRPTRYFGLGAERMLSCMSNCQRGAVRGGL